MRVQARFFDEKDAEHLFSAMQDCRAFIRKHGIESTDVRVNASEGGSWTLHTGDASYDQDHRGYWGSGGIDATDDDKRLGESLADMVDQACDQASDEGACGSEGIGMPETVEIHAICRHVAS